MNELYSLLLWEFLRIQIHCLAMSLYIRTVIFKAETDKKLIHGVNSFFFDEST